MKNIDTLIAEKNAAFQRMFEASKGDDEQAFRSAFTGWADTLQEAVLAEARGLIQANDQNILMGRGVRVLTSEERSYYQGLVTAMTSKNPKSALSDVDVVLPRTVIDMVFDDLTEARPLLDMINFQNTGAIVEFILSTSDGVAGWGELCSDITDEISGAFMRIDLTLKKLSAFIPVCKAMLDLGPEWLDRYVRTILAEALAAELESAIVDGDGDGKPIGMTRKLSGAVDSVYPRKDPVTVDKLNALTFGEILDTLSQGPNNKRRAVNNLIMAVNPADYYKKVFPATTIRATNGSYNRDVLPYPTTIIQSNGVPAGFAVFGIPRRYFFGLGTSKGGRIEYSDEYRFLEDERVYLIKLYGNGRALDENAFVYADISGLEPEDLRVSVANFSDIPTA